MSSGFPYFLQLKSEFGNKKFMIWATVSSWSCFCWLYIASPSLAAKNITNLISVLTIWWCPCVESSLVFLEEGVHYPVCSLGKTLLAFDPLCFVLQGQLCMLLQVSLDFLLFAFQSLVMKRTSFLGVSSRRSCRIIWYNSFANLLGKCAGVDFQSILRENFGMSHLTNLPDHYFSYFCFTYKDVLLYAFLKHTEAKWVICLTS